MSEPDYQAFQSRLMPTVDKKQILGVRTPKVRAFGKELFKSGNYAFFLSDLPHLYYEENNLHGVLICQMKDYDETIRALDAFLPYVDNWATCDLLTPRSFAKNKDRLPSDIKRYLCSPLPFTVRFGLEMIMNFFLGDDYDEALMREAAGVVSDAYYVNMMIAWLFATALAKNWEQALPYLENPILKSWTHNKTIQKAKESDRLSDKQKEYLQTLILK